MHPFIARWRDLVMPAYLATYKAKCRLNTPAQYKHSQRFERLTHTTKLSFFLDLLINFILLLQHIIHRIINLGKYIGA